MAKKIEAFQKKEVSLLSPLSLLRLVVYIIILYLLANYYTHGITYIISLLLLVGTLFLPFPKLHNWWFPISSYLLTGGLAYFIFKAGLVRFGLFILIIGLSIGSWLIPSPVLAGSIILTLVLSASALANRNTQTQDSKPPVFAPSVPGRGPLVEDPNIDNLFPPRLNNGITKSSDIEEASAVPIEEVYAVATVAIKMEEEYSADIADVLISVGAEIWKIVSESDRRNQFIADGVLAFTIEQVGSFALVELKKKLTTLINGNPEDTRKDTQEDAENQQKPEVIIYGKKEGPTIHTDPNIREEITKKYGLSNGDLNEIEGLPPDNRYVSDESREICIPLNPEDHHHVTSTQLDSEDQRAVYIDRLRLNRPLSPEIKLRLSILLEHIVKITDYLTTVPKAKVSEIINASSLRAGTVQLILDYLQVLRILDHEPECYYKFREEAN